ncbi:MAG: cyanophycinase [Holophaga sp.]|nr:cyanophycinase [Holophaga sp.]
MSLSQRFNRACLALLVALCAFGAEGTEAPKPVPPPPSGQVVMLAGGGPEGALGDASAWSCELYRSLLSNGDRNGDGKIRVAVLSMAPSPTAFIPEYFQWLGATEAFNLSVMSRTQADDPALVDALLGADAVFIKGGDQGAYYDTWKGTRLHRHLQELAARGASFGGTSAGAMILAQFAFSGSKSMVSLHGLSDARTSYLDDASDGGSALHGDFLPLVTNAIIDTHFTTRARLGRLIAILAKAREDLPNQPHLFGIGIEERTGLTLRGQVAHVLGVGSVSFLQPQPESTFIREAKRPLIATNLRLDRLVHGWQFDLSTFSPDLQHVPASAMRVFPTLRKASAPLQLLLPGDQRRSEKHFEQRAMYFSPGTPSDDFTLVPGDTPPLIQGAVGFMDAHQSNTNRYVDETAYRALYERPSAAAFLVARESSLFCLAGLPNVVCFGANPTSGDAEASTLVLDASTITWKDLSPFPSNGTLHATGMVNLTIHALAESPTRRLGFNLLARRPEKVSVPAPVRLLKPVQLEGTKPHRKFSRH